MNPHVVYVNGPSRTGRGFSCSRCRAMYPSDGAAYVTHRKLCLAAAILRWDADEYSKRYYEQVRAISRFKNVINPNRRNKYRAWNWWLVKPDGPPLTAAEVSG